jgi:DNA-binding MarR family transcriptional regulator
MSDGAARGATSASSRELLRLWLRALALTNVVEKRVRARLREEFGVTLPRFDVMAALHESPEGMNMGEVSRRLMVSNGNVTGIMARLEEEGLVRKSPKPGDRRTQIVRLTDTGSEAFEEMAEAHAAWISAMFSSLSAEEVETLGGLLKNAKNSVLESDEVEES